MRVINDRIIIFGANYLFKIFFNFFYMIQIILDVRLHMHSKSISIFQFFAEEYATI